MSRFESCLTRLLFLFPTADGTRGHDWEAPQPEPRQGDIGQMQPEPRPGDIRQMQPSLHLTSLDMQELDINST